MTKKKLNREIKDAAAPAIEVVRLLVEQMRQQGQSDAEILAALDRLERDNPAKVDADVMAVVMGEIRKSIVLAPSSLVLNQDGSCGMGLNVSAAGTYKRVSSTPPKFDE